MHDVRVPERFVPLLQQLAQRCYDVDTLLGLPLEIVRDLASGEADAADLDELLEWLQRAKELSQSSVELAEALRKEAFDAIPSAFKDAEGLKPLQPTPGLLGIVSLRGSCAWGEWLSSKHGFNGELGTCKGVWGNDCRWELHLLSGGLFALRNLESRCWLTGEAHHMGSCVKCDRQVLQEWEQWTLLVLPPWNEGECNIALRSHHGKFLCQEPPRFPTFWPPQRWLGSGHRLASGVLNVAADKKDVNAWETFTLADAQGKALGGKLLRLVQTGAGHHG